MALRHYTNLYINIYIVIIIIFINFFLKFASTLCTTQYTANWWPFLCVNQASTSHHIREAADVHKLLIRGLIQTVGQAVVVGDRVSSFVAYAYLKIWIF